VLDLPRRPQRRARRAPEAVRVPAMGARRASSRPFARLDASRDVLSRGVTSPRFFL
jgi:hypothetical protein